MGSNVVKEAKKRADNYRKAVSFLEGLKNFTYNDLIKSMKMAGTEMTESDNLQVWIKATAKSKAGAEPLRQILIISLQTSIKNFEEAGRLGG